MKMMFHIDDFKCTLCANWFCPPFNLPYLLPCTHSICTNCLQKASNNDHIICPEDLEACPIQSININLTTKRALQRLMKEHKNYNQNTQLQCIKTLSIGFDEVLQSKQKQLRNLEALIDQIFLSQIERLKHLHQKIKIDINRPFKIVQDWKQIVASHLTSIRKNHSNSGTNYDSKSNNMLQLNHYIEEGRKMKMQLYQFFQMEFDIFADKIMRTPRVCFQKEFSISSEFLENKLKKKSNNQTNVNNIALERKQSNSSKQTKLLKNQSQFRICQDEPIQNNTVLLVGQGKKSIIANRSLANKDINKLSVSDFQQIQNVVETRRGSHRQKNGNLKTSEMNLNQIANLDKYISFEEPVYSRTSAKGKQNLKQFQSKHERPTLSPNRGSKMVQMKRGKYQRKDESSINKQVPRTQMNTKSIQKNKGDLSLSQFQMQNIANQNQSALRQGQRPLRQTNIYQSRPIQTAQKESPSKGDENYQKINKLARMLENTSSQASNQNSLRNSLRRMSRHIQSRTSNHHQSSIENSLLISPNAIREQYTEEADQSSIPYQEQQLLNNDDMLLTEDKNYQNNWQLGNINFLRQWKVKNENSLQQPLEVRQNTYYYNCQKQKLSYMRKMQIYRVQQALKRTQIKNNYIEHIGESLHDVDMNLYLQQFDWKHSNIEIVKFVKSCLTDEQLNIILNYLVHSNVKTLVISNNCLTEMCLDALLNFVSLNHVLKNVYLNTNNINSLKSKSKINALRERGVNIYS